MKKRIVKFSVIGVGVALLGAIEMWIFVHVFGWEQNISYFIQSMISMQLNFMLNNSYTWGDIHGNYWGKMFRFYVSRGGILFVNQVIFGVIVSFSPNLYLIAYIGTVGIVTVINFISGDKFVFRSSQLQGE